MTEKSLGWGHLKPVTDAFNRAMAAPEAPAGFAGQFVLVAVNGRYYEAWYCVSSKDCSATAAGLNALESYLNGALPDFYTEIILVTSNQPGNSYLEALNTLMDALIMDVDGTVIADKAVDGPKGMEAGSIWICFRITPLAEMKFRPESLRMVCSRIFTNGFQCQTYTNKAGAVTGAILAFVPREAEPKEEQLGEFLVNANVFGWEMMHSTMNSTFATRHDMMALEVRLREMKVEA